MAYQIRRDDRNIKAMVRRIARERIDSALERASELPDAAGVHEIRKETKKLRGLLQLVKPRFKGAARANAALKRGAAELAQLRDAEVRLATFDSLAEALDDPAPTEPIRAVLAEEVERLRAPKQLRAATKALRETLLQLRGEIGDWKIKGGGFDVLGEGLGTTWRQARRDMKRAGRSFNGAFNAEPFHDWRRSVKHHWYQARILEPLWPEMMAPHIAAADALGALLGDHNDLDVLVVRLAGDLPEDTGPAAARLTERALERRHLLAGRALILGRRLLADRPEALVARWGCWWALWRG